MSTLFNNNLHSQLPGKFDRSTTHTSYNGLQYQRFLNSDVKGFTFSLGFGSQESSLSLELVETQNPPYNTIPTTNSYSMPAEHIGKVDAGGETYSDISYNEFWAGCDLTGFPEQICDTEDYNGQLGHVYTFNLKDKDQNNIFTYTGILADHDIKVDSNGKTVSARITDGKQYLDNFHLILDKTYSRNFIYGADGTSVNMLNVLYEIERGVAQQYDLASDGSVPVDGSTSYSACAYFMDSGKDDSGIPVTYILGQFMSSTRYLSLPLTKQNLRLNIDQVYNSAVTRASYLKINDTSISLLKLIEQVCEETACDFYITMEETADYQQGPLHCQTCAEPLIQNELVVRLIDRSQPLNPDNTLLGFLEEAFGSKGSYKNLSYGQESTHENTQNVIFGSKYRYFVEIQRNTQYPIYQNQTFDDTDWRVGSRLPTSIKAEANVPRVTGVQDGVVRTLGYTPAPTDGCYDPEDFESDVPGITCGLPTGGGRIMMVLGEELNPVTEVTTQGIPTHKMYTSNLCGDYMNIEYDIQPLCAILGLDCAGLTASLTEEELLFTQSYEAYINWAVMHPGSIGYTLGSALFGSLWGNFQSYSLKIFADIVDNGSFDSFKDPAIAFPDAEVASKRFEVVHAYVKNIYDQFYGKEYVALLDRKFLNDITSPAAEAAPDPTSKFNNFEICIGKSYNLWNASNPSGDFPQSLSDIVIPVNDSADFLYKGRVKKLVKTAGKGLISASDTIINGAWFNRGGQSSILSLNQSNGLSQFLNDDNTISCFVKYGPIKDICKRIAGQVFSFQVDLSALNPDEFTIVNQTDPVTGSGVDNLYLKAAAREEMFFGSMANDPTSLWDDYALGDWVDDYTWARFSMPRVKLIPSNGSNLAANRAASKLALIALQAITDTGNLAAITSGTLTLGEAIKDKLAGGGVNPGIWDGISANLAATNLAKMSTPAIVPEAVALPFESQTRSYGPWGRFSNPSGGFNVKDYDLAPWQFGIAENTATQNAASISYASLNSAGNSLASNGVFGRTYQEKATVNLPYIPNIDITKPGGLGYTSFTAVADANTILTDIGFSFGADGASTNLTYSTYSPKFGNAPEHIIDASKQVTSQKLEYMSEFRKANVKNMSQALKLRQDLEKIYIGRNVGAGGGSSTTEDGTQNSRYSHSPSKIIMGGYLNKNQQSDLVNSDDGNTPNDPETTKHQYTDSCEDIDTNPDGLTTYTVPTNDGNKLKRYATSEMHPTYYFDYAQKEYYKNMSLMSLDGLYLPVSIAGGPNNNLVRYSNYTSATDLPKGRPITMMPPVNVEGGSAWGDLEINQKYLNPMCSVGTLAGWDNRECNSDQGFVIINIAWGDTPDKNFNFDDIKTPSGVILHDRQEQTDFRFNAMRGPLVLQAWGYDINGKPIPNANDSATAAESGMFRSNNLEDKFLKNWLSNPRTWPVGPIDLRWDRNRGVWVSPPSSKIVVARLTSTLGPFSTATAELLNPSAGGKEFYQDYSLYGTDGQFLNEDVRNLTVTVHDYIGSTISKCAIVLLYYADGKYMVIQEGGVRNLQRARISSDETLSCNGQCQAELFTVSTGGGITYGDIGGITVSDTMGIVSQTLAGLTRVWVYKPEDSQNYEVVYIGTRSDADCGSCGGFGVYQVAGVDFNRLPTVASVGKVVTVTDGGCLALVDTKNCGGITS